MVDVPTQRILPTPTPELVEAQCREFDRDSYNELYENSLRQLHERFPLNTDPAQVLLKALVLNKLYSARVNDIHVKPLVEHIVHLGVDAPIGQGEPSVVWHIFTCENLPKYYSFATKFCSWHNPEAYPIYDRYADACLWAYQKRDHFTDFHRQDMWYYDKFITIVSAFRKHYSLDGFSFRDIDKFLWRMGAKILGE